MGYYFIFISHVTVECVVFTFIWSNRQPGDKFGDINQIGFKNRFWFQKRILFFCFLIWHFLVTLSTTLTAQYLLYRGFNLLQHRNFLHPGLSCLTRQAPRLNASSVFAIECRKGEKHYPWDHAVMLKQSYV